MHCYIGYKGKSYDIFRRYHPCNMAAGKTSLAVNLRIVRKQCMNLKPINHVTSFIKIDQLKCN